VGLAVDDIPVDTPDIVKDDMIGSQKNIEMVHELTAEQAEEYLADLDRLLMDRDLTPEQQRMKVICLKKLTDVKEQERHGAGEERELTVAERHEELRQHIQIMRWRHGRT
jgi:hypothetical protein